MRLLFRLILFLVIAVAVALLAFAFTGDLSPVRTERTEPLRIELR